MTPLIGLPGERLSGIESRTLREALGIDREHVAAITTALNLWEKGDASTRIVSDWERAKGFGYPLALSQELLNMNEAEERLADAIFERVATTAREGYAFRRPLTGDDIGPAGVVFRTGNVPFSVLNRFHAGDLWGRLANAAMLRAAASLVDEGVDVHLNGAPLRMSLLLERRHIVGLSAALRFMGSAVDDGRVAAWEDSERYPPPVREYLRQLSADVDDMVDHLFDLAFRGNGNVATVIRPRATAAWIYPGLGGPGSELPPAFDKAMQPYGEDFWHCIVGAAITRLVLSLQAEGALVRVELEPNGHG